MLRKAHVRRSEGAGGDSAALRFGRVLKPDRLIVTTLALAASVSHELSDPSVDRVYFRASSR